MPASRSYAVWSAGSFPMAARYSSRAPFVSPSVSFASACTTSDDASRAAAAAPLAAGSPRSAAISRRMSSTRNVSTAARRRMAGSAATFSCASRLCTASRSSSALSHWPADIAFPTDCQAVVSWSTARPSRRDCSVTAESSRARRSCSVTAAAPEACAVARSASSRVRAPRAAASSRWYAANRASISFSFAAISASFCRRKVSSCCASSALRRWSSAASCFSSEAADAPAFSRRCRSASRSAASASRSACSRRAISASRPVRRSTSSRPRSSILPWMPMISRSFVASFTSPSRTIALTMRSSPAGPSTVRATIASSLRSKSRGRTYTPAAIRATAPRFTSRGRSAPLFRAWYVKLSTGMGLRDPATRSSMWARISSRSREVISASGFCPEVGGAAGTTLMGPIVTRAGPSRHGSGDAAARARAFSRIDGDHGPPL